MKPQHAYKIIQWYDVAKTDLGNLDSEDYFIFQYLLASLKDCHQYIPGMKGLTYHNYFLFRFRLNSGDKDVKIDDYIL